MGTKPAYLYIPGMLQAYCWTLAFLCLNHIDRFHCLQDNYQTPDLKAFVTWPLPHFCSCISTCCSPPQPLVFLNHIDLVVVSQAQASLSRFSTSLHFFTCTHFHLNILQALYFTSLPPKSLIVDLSTVKLCFLGGSSSKEPPANAEDIREPGSIPGLGRSPGGGHGNPPQYSCLENPTGRGAWQATVHAVAKSQTRLKQLSTYSCMAKLVDAGTYIHLIITSLYCTYISFICLSHYPGNLLRKGVFFFSIKCPIAIW